MSGSVKRGQRVVQRRRRPAKAANQPAGAGRGAAGRAPKAAGQALDLRHAELDPEYLGKKPYLTYEELAVYGSFKTQQAVRSFLSKNRVPRAAGRVRRRDFDRAFEVLLDARRERDRHAPQSRPTSAVRSSELSSPAGSLCS